VPLSEHEQRLLEQMERALYAEDPKFASTLRSGGPRAGSRGRALLGVLGFLAGLGLLMAGAILPMIAVGILGFVLMLVGAVVVYAAMRPAPAGSGEAAAAEGPTVPTGPSAPKPKKSSGFMDKVEDRWRRRRETGGM
jgi:hypothetical protein